MQAYKIMARNTRTKQRVTEQNLAGLIITDAERANTQALLFAERMNRRSPDLWEGEVELYTVGHRPGSEIAR